jgi:hypothetical protein
VITRCGRRVAIGLKKLPIVDIPVAKRGIPTGRCSWIHL